MDLKSLKLETKSYSSTKEIETTLEDLEVPVMPLSASLKRNRRFTNLSINIKKSKFLPKKKFLLEDKFDILEVLGAGAYSCVKSAIEKATDRKVAIKTCRGENGRDMLTSEYGMLKRLHEDHIIKVFDLIIDDASDESHMTMEYFSSTSIHDYITLNGTFNEDDSRVIIKQVFEAINSLHKNGITHCDIKPENILLNEDKEVKLIDFNISKSKCDSELSPDTADTKFGSFSSLQLSSPLYAAPEMKNRKYSQSVDIWGTGIVLFTLLLDTMKSHELNKIKDLDERSQTMKKIIEDSTKITEDTKEFLYKLLSNESEDRPTAREALADSWFLC